MVALITQKMLKSFCVNNLPRTRPMLIVLVFCAYLKYKSNKLDRPLIMNELRHQKPYTFYIAYNTILEIDKQLAQSNVLLCILTCFHLLIKSQQFIFCGL